VSKEGWFFFCPLCVKSKFNQSYKDIKKSKFNQSYKDIKDEKFNEVVRYIEFLKNNPS